jgi:hypothetical protein
LVQRWLGWPKKTFVLVPIRPATTLPTYFSGIETLRYEDRKDDNFTAATGARLRQAANWFKPCLQRHRLTLYKREDVMAAVWRLANGEYPEST